MILVALVHNIALLVALAAGLQVLAARQQQDGIRLQILSGLLFGGAGLVGMMAPVQMGSNVIFDGRSIILSTAGLFGGPVVALVAALLCGSYRLWLGGDGVAMGVAVIVEAAALGVLFRRLRLKRSGPTGALWFLGFGLAVHAVMLALTALLPWEVRGEVWRQIGWAFLVLYPVATMLVCLLFADYEAHRGTLLKLAADLAELRKAREALEQSERQHKLLLEERMDAEEALKASDQKFRSLFQLAPDAIYVHDLQGRFVDANKAAEAMAGYGREEWIGKSFADLNLVAGDDLALAEASLALNARGLATGPSEYTLARKNGEKVTVETRAFPVEIEGQPRVLGVARDITDRKRAEHDLLQSQEQLRALSARLETLREEERTRISREVHDELGQVLTAIKMDLRWVEYRLDVPGEGHRFNPILDKLAGMANLVDAAVKTVQRIAAELRPGILDKLGLPIALEYEASQFEARTGIVCELQLPAENPDLQPRAATAFFRICQEALTNVARHARATRVEVELQPRADFCRLEVRDNGQGTTNVDLSDTNSLGLLGMQERARLLGGEVSMRARPGGGTVISVLIPTIRPNEEAP